VQHGCLKGLLAMITKPDGLGMPALLTTTSLRHSLAIILGFTAATSAVASTCEAPRRTDGLAPAAAGKREIFTDPAGIRFQKADDLRRVDRDSEAAEIYRELTKAPADRRQTARKAALRLAQYELANNRFDAARGLVDSATRSGANPAILREGAYIRKRIDYDLAVARAEGRLAEVEMKRTSSVAPLSLLPEYQFLLTMACPYPDDFQLEVHERMAMIHGDAGNFDMARQEMASADAQLANVTGPRLAILRDKLAVRRADLEARALIAGAATLPEIEKRAAYDRILTMTPAPGEQLLIRAHLLAADSHMRENDFAKASERIELASRYSAEATTLAAVRLDRSRSKLASEQADYLFRNKLQQIDALRSTSPDKSIPQYRALIGAYPAAEAIDQAKLALADALRQERYFAEARSIVDAVAAAPTSPKTPDQVARMRSRLDKSSPDQMVRGQIRMASYYDTNAPTLATELREEQDDIVYPLNQEFDDGVLDLDGRLTYSKRISDNYDYWETELHARKTTQFNLTPLDRAIFDITSGPVFNLPASRATLRVAGLFRWESRGGDFLRANYGGLLEGTKRLSSAADARLLLSAVHNNDTRPSLDGTYLTARGSVDFQISDSVRLTPTIAFERRDVRSATLDNSRIAVGATYSVAWPSDTHPKGLDLAARHQWVRYDRVAGVANRNDSRFEASATGWIEITPKTRLFAEYRYNNPNSNYANLERLENNRVGVGVVFSFD